MLNDASSLLLAISGVSAGFVAILGGFIASKLIAINSERDIAESNLEEVKYQKFLKTEERDILRRSMDEEDSLCYLYEHMEELEDGLALEAVYEYHEVQTIDFESLLPYWEKASFYIEQFEEYLKEENCQLNNNMIPCELAEESKDDAFIYKFLTMYAVWKFTDDVVNLSSRTQIQWYEKTREQCMQANMQAAALDVQEQRYKMDLNRAKNPEGIKTGLVIFAVFSLLNIIAPLILSVIQFSEQECLMVTYCSIGSLALGLGAIFWYLLKMLNLKKKEDAKKIYKQLMKSCSD